MAKKVISLGAEPPIVISISGHAVKLLSKYYLYTHRSGLLSTLVTEASFFLLSLGNNTKAHN